MSDHVFLILDTGIPATKITMGPFTFSINEIKTALTVALMVFPCNLLIILLFKKAGPKISKNSNRYETVKVLGKKYTKICFCYQKIISIEY